MSYLPPLSADQQRSRLILHQGSQLSPLTIRPPATKAEKYANFVKVDQHQLGRPRAHFRNALKTTEGLQRVHQQLKDRLQGLHNNGAGISFERLSAFRDAFNDIIRMNQTYGPQLNQIKEAYNEYIHFVLSQQLEKGQLGSPGCGLGRYWQPTSNSEDIFKLKKRVHQLEVELRVLLCENERLRAELSQEQACHKLELERIRTAGEDAIEGVLNEPLPLKDYAARVEELRQKIFQKQDAISQEFKNREGSVPLTVCNNLEQCLREVEIESQKHYRKNQNLRTKIQKKEKDLLTLLQTRGLKLSSDLSDVLGLK